MHAIIKRILALGPLAMSAVVVALTIVIMVAGPITNKGNTGYWLSLNTSKIGANAIVLSTATPGQPNPTDPLGILPALNGMLGGLINNVTGQINQGIGDMTGDLITTLIKSMGVRDFYNFYLTGVCEGYYANPNDPNTPYNVECSSYSNELAGLRNISRSIPSSFVVGNTNVSVPMIAALGHTVETMSNLSSFASGAILAILSISCALAGITMLGSFAAALLGYRRVLLVFNASASGVAAGLLNVFALAATAVAMGMSGAIEGFGSAFTLHTRMGKAFLAEAWVAAVLGGAVAGFWINVWFIDGRRHAFKRRLRTQEQIGNYRGILRELINDWKVDEPALVELKMSAAPRGATRV